MARTSAGTDHQMIMRAMEHSLPWEKVLALLDDLLVAMRKFDCRRARELLLHTIAEYQPSARDRGPRLAAALRSERNALRQSADDHKVTELATRRAARTRLLGLADAARALRRLRFTQRRYLLPCDPLAACSATSRKSLGVPPELLVRAASPLE